MDFNSFGYSSSFNSSSSSSSKGKVLKKSNGVSVEEDFLGRFGVVEDGYIHGVVDCSLRLGLPPRIDNNINMATTPSSDPKTFSTCNDTNVKKKKKNVVGNLVSPPTTTTTTTTTTIFPSSNAQQHQTSFVVTEFCTMCAAKHTPLWRTGPYGPKSLCNACGIRYKKEEKRLALSLGIPSTQCNSKRQQQTKKSF